MRHHSSVKCWSWLPKIQHLWRRVEIDCEWGAPRAPSVRALFRDVRATLALLEFLEDTRVGHMPSQILLAGGRVEGEDNMEVLELLSQGEEAETSEEREEGDGPAGPAPLECFVFSFVFTIY